MRDGTKWRSQNRAVRNGAMSKGRENFDQDIEIARDQTVIFTMALCQSDAEVYDNHNPPQHYTGLARNGAAEMACVEMAPAEMAQDKMIMSV